MQESNIRNESTQRIQRHIESGEVCCDSAWEDAYKRFETPEEEIKKFIRRLKAFGLQDRPKDIRVVELFCGRGGGLVALQRLGFTNLDGVDLSETLLQQNQNNARLHLADCRSLPFDDESIDAVVVHGGLHHLPCLPGDLESVLKEIQRVLKPSGTFHAVEPWLTPFLRFVHVVVENHWVRKFYDKGDALAVMIEHERETYEQWLHQPDSIRKLFDRFFVAKTNQSTWGKFQFTGVRKETPEMGPFNS
jgi:ubiquinone/menaquinone biosynthesis C-methylase UbiE